MYFLMRKGHKGIFFVIVLLSFAIILPDVHFKLGCVLGALET